MPGRPPLDGETSSEIRRKYLELSFIPLCRRVFAQDPEVQSLIVVVGQYWDDEADDAVHIDVFPCGDAAPRWPACLGDERWLYVEVDEDDPITGVLNERGASLTGWPTIRDLPMLDDNSSAITAFAAYCLPGSHQGMSPGESHTPYAIGRRGASPDDVEVEIVGTMHQPQWEDRFDVGYLRNRGD